MNNSYDYKILVVDDNPEIHSDFLKILTSETHSAELDTLQNQIFGEQVLTESVMPNFKIDTASQGEEAIQLTLDANANNARYALAFVDIRMPPGLDGVETIKQIWKVDDEVQVVICTAYSDYSWEETVSQLGQRDNLFILKKPFDITAVRQLACALTKKWQLMHENKSHTAVLENSIEEKAAALKEHLSLVRATLESSADGIVVVGHKGNIIDFNSRILTMWNLKRNDLMQHDFNHVFKKILEQIRHPDKLVKKINEITTNPESITIDVVNLKNERTYEYYSQPQKMHIETLGRVWSFRDITQRTKLEDKLKYNSTHDALTGLPNRLYLIEKMNELVTKQGNHFTLVFLDLDRFKLVNDTLDHAIGDQLLIETAKRIENCLSPNDTLARIGSDEYLILVNRNFEREETHKLAQHILESINEPWHIDKRDVRLTASIGVSVYPKDGDKSDMLLRNASISMCYSKKTGGNKVSFYTDKMSEQNMTLLERESDLRKAIVNEEFFLCYQPQVDLASEKVVAVEALIRWNHPVKGVLMPADFVPLAEQIGLIIPIGEWVLKAACKQAREWLDQGLSPVRMAVNVTSKQLNQYNFVKTIVDILNEAKLDPSSLELELTENTILESETSIEMIHSLKNLGVHLALDDFGTGYSSLSYLRNIPLDRLKIDRSFIQNIQVNHKDEAIIQAIIDMARSLGLEVLAEGVETKSQLDFLKTKKCGEIQGFYYSKPLTSKELEGIMKNKREIKTYFTK